MSEVIQSPSNPRIRQVRALAEAKTRRREQKFVVEGVRLVEAVLDAGVPVVEALVDREQLVRTERGRALLRRLADYPIVWVGPRALRAATDTEHPQGVVAVVPLPENKPPADLGPLVLVVDRLRDPGNLGTLLRTAEATGLIRTVFVQDSVDAYAPKVVRGGMGAHFWLAICRDVPWPVLRDWLDGRPVRLATAGGRCHYDAVDWTGDAALLIGGEAEGCGPEAERLATETVRIDMAGHAESLNAAVAASIIMFEAVRQRRRAVPPETH